MSFNLVKEQQSFWGLLDHLQNVFQSWETLSKLISDFYSQAQKNWEVKAAFASDLQVLARK